VKEKKELSEIVGFEEAMKEASDELGNKGRVFVRYSGTENKMRILIESDDMTKVEKIGKKLSEIVKEQIGVEK
jgi:phosphoglucosamine mutase